MRDDLGQFGFGDAILESKREMTRKLPGVAASDQGGDGDQTPIPWGESGASPDIAEKHVVGEFGELGQNVSNEELGA